MITIRNRLWLGLTAVVGVIALIVAGIIFDASRNREPQFQGKKLSVWLDDYAAENLPFIKSPPQFDEAIREIGTNALPYVVRNLARNDSALHRKYRDLWLKSPKRLQKHLPQPRRLLKEGHGAEVFAYIGKSSLMSAIALLQHDSPTVRRSAALGICRLRRQSVAVNQAIPALIAALGDPDNEVQWNALQAFREMREDASNAVPAITKILASTGRSPTNWAFDVHAAAASTLGKMGPAASSALPVLRAALQATNSYLRGQVAVAIWRISADVDTALPVLLREMPNESESRKWEWITAIGEMGPRAKAALPQLERELAEAKQSWTLDFVTMALRRVDPESFEKKSEP